MVIYSSTSESVNWALQFRRGFLDSLPGTRIEYALDLQRTDDSNGCNFLSMRNGKMNMRAVFQTVTRIHTGRIFTSTTTIYDLAQICAKATAYSLELQVAMFLYYPVPTVHVAR